MSFNSLPTFNRLRLRVNNPTAFIVWPIDTWLPPGWEYQKRDDTFFNDKGHVVYDLSDIWKQEEIPVLEYYSEDINQTLIEIGVVETGNLTLLTKLEYLDLLRDGYRAIFEDEECYIENVKPRFDLCIFTIARVGRDLRGHPI